jgi:hypothetical protein
MFDLNCVYKIESIMKDGRKLYTTGTVIDEDEHLIRIRTIKNEDFNLNKADISQSTKVVDD